MCYSASAIASSSSSTQQQDTADSFLLDEKLPLIPKNKVVYNNQLDNDNSNNNNTNNSIMMSSSSMIQSILYNSLNKVSTLTSIIGITYYCYLVTQGEYTQWGIPLFVSSCICKLLSATTSPRGSYDEHYKSSSSLHQKRGMVPRTFFHRHLQENTILHKLSCLYKYIRITLNNDNNYNVIFLSLLIIILPSLTYFYTKLHDHLLSFTQQGEGINHTKLANDFGKLAAAAFTFLLLPVTKHSTLLSNGSSLKLSEVHMIRLHIYAGYLVIFGTVVHGLYYTIIWIKIKKFTYIDVFPTSSEGCFDTLYDYSTDCYDTYINLLGIISGLLLVLLCISSLYIVRRRYYKLFYTFHIGISTVVLFGLVMHYNKMIWYLLPSLLYYLGSNVPIYIESLYKYIKLRGVKVTKVVCIPNSNGCVDISLSMNNNDERQQRSSTFQDTIGRYILLSVPELSYQSHPFTIFASSSSNGGDDNVHILFRPCGSFTMSLSKRLRSLTLLPELTPSEIETSSSFTQHKQQQQQQGRDKTKCCPMMLVNGIRSTCGYDMFVNATEKHDKVVIIAGGVGIVTYISLIHAIIQHQQQQHRQQQQEKSSVMSMSNEEEEVVVGSTVVEASHSTTTKKCIEIHWMSRDEGLIKHVLENHLKPSFCTYSPHAYSTISINLVVHHTNPMSTTSSTTDCDDGSINEEPTTWKPSQHDHGTMSPSSNVNNSTASLTSIYEGNKSYLTLNILPTITYGLIIYGGFKIVQYCYDEIQEKHVFQTRTISVFGILLLVLVVSILSNIVSLVGTFIYSKLFMYTKLEEEESNNVNHDRDHDDELENGTSQQLNEIELSSNNNDNDGRFAISDESSDNFETETLTNTDNNNNNYNHLSRKANDDNVMFRISHNHGRPNLTNIIHDVMKADIIETEEEREGNDDCVNSPTKNDIGIFMCGPTSMTDSIWKAVTNEKKSSSVLSTETFSECETMKHQVSVYQEVFEL